MHVPIHSLSLLRFSFPKKCPHSSSSFSGIKPRHFLIASLSPLTSSHIEMYQLVLLALSLNVSIFQLLLAISIAILNMYLYLLFSGFCSDSNGLLTSLSASIQHSLPRRLDDSSNTIY